MKHGKREGLGPFGLALSMLGSLLGLASACSDEAPIPDLDSSHPPTYYADVAPIFSDKCIGCHQAGGIGPFALNDYEAAREHGLIIADYTRDRVMPPFGIDTGGDCGSFDEDVTLTEAEIALIGEWGRGERAEGTPAEVLVRPPPALAGATDFALPDFTPVIQRSELALFDEYRCFALDPNVSLGKDITQGA